MPLFSLLITLESDWSDTERGNTLLTSDENMVAWIEIDATGLNEIR